MMKDIIGNPPSLHSVESQATVLIGILTHFNIDCTEYRSPEGSGTVQILLEKDNKKMVIDYNTLTAEGRILSKS